MSDLHKILNRAINDEQFAKTLKENPAEAMKQAGPAAKAEKRESAVSA